MIKKFKEFKTYIIIELTEIVKHNIQKEIHDHGILKGYKDQLEKVTSTVEMLQQHVSNLKHQNSVLQDKVKMYRQIFESRCKEKCAVVVLESIRMLLLELFTKLCLFITVLC